MKPRQVVPLFVCALLVGWFAPNLDTAQSDAEFAKAATAPAAQGGAATDRTDQWLTGQTVLGRQPDGHFYTDATIDGVRINLLVDTGASVVALTGQDAAALGLEWDEASLQPIGRGANGVVHGVATRLDRIEIESIEARGVEAAIIPDGLDVSLLGQSFLSKVQTVEISGDEMKLGG